MPHDFDKARRKRLLDKSSEHTSPPDALGLARDYLETEPDARPLLVIIQRPEGGVTTYFSDCTFAEAVYLLEQAKFSLLVKPGAP